MNVRAAILWERGEPLSVEPVELAPPGPGEILVEIKAAGVCHSDLHPARGDWPTRTPLVLGHEGAGIVRDVGSGVTRHVPGDHVVFCWAPACGSCPPCVRGQAVLCDRLDQTTYRNRLPSGGTKLKARGRDLGHFLGTACFADYAVVAEEGAVGVGVDVPFEVLAPVGCAVLTGVGAVLNAARVPAGASVTVIGTGGVGLNVVQGAVLAGCASIVAVDRLAPALERATRLGATHTVDAAATSLPDALAAITGGAGADFVFDTVGSAETLATALAATRKGGTVVLTGLSRIEGIGEVPMFSFVMQEKRLIGSVYGSGRPAEDIGRVVEWYRTGRLKLNELVGRVHPLEGVNEALDLLARGGGGRNVLRP